MVGTALVQGTSFAILFILPVVVRREFGANNLQTVLVTATPTIFFTLSIFWNDLFKRTPFGAYLLLMWLVGCLPNAFMGLAPNYWVLLAFHLVACIGGAGLPPATGELLNSLYPASRRGRSFSFVYTAWMLTGALVGLGLGRWLEHDPEAFRYYMPLGVLLQLAGIAILIVIYSATGHAALRRPASRDERSLYDRVIEPVAHTREVLRADPTFARYEGAYMTYGVGWMIAHALLPMIITDKLVLAYKQVPWATSFPYQVALVLAFWPAGWLLDRIGPIRSTGLSFFLLTFYPLGLIVASSADQLLVVSAWFGIAHAGASVGWMLGPVSLAPSRDKVPQYVAIHATMVGIRGTLFQGLGVLLYTFLGFTLPLLLAAGAYLWSAYLMLRLQKRIDAAKAAPPSTAASS